MRLILYKKPLDLNRILVTLKHATDTEQLKEETKRLRKKVHRSKSDPIIGESKAISDILDMVETVGVTDAEVLITGGNGAGKELVARQLHNGSSRKSSVFIEVNCAAFQKN